MVTLSLADTKTAILAAFNHWLDQDTKSFTLTLSGNRVTVNIHKSADRFDCGTPGYNMANRDVAALGLWVPQHIVLGAKAGSLLPCKNVGRIGQVNAFLDAAVAFNFHVNLVGPC